MNTIDDLHLELGKFLTASSRLEHIMMSIVVSCRMSRGEDIEDVFGDFMRETFGGMVTKFRNTCNLSSFSPDHRAILDEAYLSFDRLLPKRNALVHGATYEFGKAGSHPQPYRIGIIKGDFDFLNKALADSNAPHVFSISRIQETAAECDALRDRLEPVSNELVQSLVRRDYRRESR